MAAITRTSTRTGRLLRHLTGNERWWFRIQFAGEDVPMLYYSDDDPDQCDPLGRDLTQICIRDLKEDEKNGSVGYHTTPQPVE